MRILLVDDHPLLQQRVAHILRAEPAIEIVGEAGNGKLAVEMAREVLPDVVVMDTRMPGMDGIEATKQCRAELPQVRVIALSMFADDEQAQAMLAAGAGASVSKSASPERLLTAVRACSRRANGPGTSGCP